MTKKAVVYFFHIYQPPWQTRELFLQIYKDSYEPLIALLEKRSELKITLNMIGSLTEKLVQEEKFDFIERVRALVKKGQIELVGSAMYHPILPLIPQNHVIRQVELNEEINNKYFKEEWASAEITYGKRGFFIPEIAYSTEVAQILEKEGFDWVTLDKTGLGIDAQVDWNKKYKIKNSNLNLLIRNSDLYDLSKQDAAAQKIDYAVLIQDGELELTESKDSLKWDWFFEKHWGKGFRYLTAGEYLSELNEEIEVQPIASNWQMTESEFRENSFYHIWKNEKDEIHTMLWEFLQEVLNIVEENKNDPNFVLSQTQLDKALSSCTWWWVDGRFYGYDPTSIMYGLNVLINVIRSFANLDKEKRIMFEKKYTELLFKIWERHWNKLATT